VVTIISETLDSLEFSVTKESTQFELSLHGGINSLESIFIQEELNKILQIGFEPNKCRISGLNLRRMKGAVYNKISIQTVTDMTGFSSTNPNVS
jgi:hypothetical protein